MEKDILSDTVLVTSFLTVDKDVSYDLQVEMINNKLILDAGNTAIEVPVDFRGAQSGFLTISAPKGNTGSVVITPKYIDDSDSQVQYASDKIVWKKQELVDSKASILQGASSQTYNVDLASDYPEVSFYLKGINDSKWVITLLSTGFGGDLAFSFVGRTLRRTGYDN